MATNDFQPFAYGGAANVVTQSAYLALTSTLQNGFSSGVATSAQLNKVWRQSSIMSAVLAQLIVNTTGQNATDDGTTATLLTNLINAISANSEATIGAVRNLAMSVTAASATATLTADEIVVGSALGGLKYTLPSFSKTINLGTTGAGGMDTGSAPASGFVALYAIYNPTTQTAALLATNATSAVAPNVYGGANMPSGYTASALVSVWPTNGSSQFVAGGQIDRLFSYLAQVAALSTATATTNTALTVAGVPYNAKRLSANVGCSGTATAAGAAQQIQVYPISGASWNSQAYFEAQAANAFQVSGTLWNFPLITPRTVYYTAQTSSTTGNNYGISIYGYEI